jgi:hypothetical protein
MCLQRKRGPPSQATSDFGAKATNSSRLRNTHLLDHLAVCLAVPLRVRVWRGVRARLLGRDSKRKAHIWSNWPRRMTTKAHLDAVS